jgi:hypothetical protein
MATQGTPETRRPLVRDIRPPQPEDPFVDVEPVVEERESLPMPEAEPQAEPVVDTRPEPVRAPAPVQTVVPAASTKDRLHKEIEVVMEADLTDLFLAMPADVQAKFKESGEQTAEKIRELAVSARKNARKIFDLLVSWLKLIPGVNRFFLEQEAKIKADKIVLLAESNDPNLS